MKNHFFIFGLLILLILASILKLCFDAMDVDNTNTSAAKKSQPDSTKPTGPAKPMDMNRVFAIVNKTPLQLKQIPKNELKALQKIKDSSRRQEYLQKVVRNEIEKFLVRHFIMQADISISPEELQKRVESLTKKDGKTLTELAAIKGVTKKQYLDTIRTSLKLERVLRVTDEKRLRAYYLENKKDLQKKMPDTNVPDFRDIREQVKSYYFKYQYKKLVERLWEKSDIQTKLDLMPHQSRAE